MAAGARTKPTIDRRRSPMRTTSRAAKELAASINADIEAEEAIFGQINAATANGFYDDPDSPYYTEAGLEDVRSGTEMWYRTERSRLVLRGLDGADLHVFDGPIETSLLSFTVRFDGQIPAEAFEAAIRGAM
jgi:hypothetical protein